ncbi:transcriptional regulator [Massilia timonae]|uniref:transcriptional regulator n=1 Tax=Massilia timonae TaxID=47229 RepID=UPI0028A842B5|nr:YdaS family helix-turn-helix protein [Massilia timonae]
MNASEIIDKLGGPTAVAKLLNVKPPSVHAWKTGGIPADKLIRLAPTLEKAGIATRQELRPDDWQQIWPELAEQSQPQ